MVVVIMVMMVVIWWRWWWYGDGGDNGDDGGCGGHSRTVVASIVLNDRDDNHKAEAMNPLHPWIRLYKSLKWKMAQEWFPVKGINLSNRFFRKAFVRLGTKESLQWGTPDFYWWITLPETNIFAPENGWLQYDRFLLWWPICRGELLVSGRVNGKFNWKIVWKLKHPMIIQQWPLMMVPIITSSPIFLHI